MTTLVTPRSASDVDDGPAIAELHGLHAVQRKAFLADPNPDAATRKGHLMALVAHPEALVAHPEAVAPGSA